MARFRRSRPDDAPDDLCPSKGPVLPSNRPILATQEARLDRSPSTPTTSDQQPTMRPEHQGTAAGSTGRGAGRPLRGNGPVPSDTGARRTRPVESSSSSSRLGRAVRRMLPAPGSPIGVEPVLSTGGGGFRSGNRPEPPIRGEVRGPVRSGTPQMGGSGGGGGPRMPRSGSPAPRPERYWTDYLRIALPIIGLILMLSLFIFWVGSIINSNSGDSTPTTVPVALVETPDPSTAAGGPPTVTVPAGGSAAASTAPQTGSNPTAAPSDGSAPTSSPGDQPSDSAAPDGQASQAPTSQVPPDEATQAAPGASGGFVEGDTVSITQDGVALRPEASVDGDPIVRLNTGTNVTVVSGPKSGGDFDWYQVKTADNQTGWIAADYLEASGGA